MILSFKDVGAEDVFNGKASRAARRVCPSVLWGVAARRLDQLDSAEALHDLRLPPGNRLEALEGQRKGTYSIRINNRYRICFIWTAVGPDEVEIVDYH